MTVRTAFHSIAAALMVFGSQTACRASDSTEREATAARSGQASASDASNPARPVTPTARADTVVFELVEQAEEKIPHVFDEVPENCAEHLYGGWYKLAGDRWAAFDSVITTCPEGRKNFEITNRHFAGTIEHAGDTLLFQQHDESPPRAVTIDRGLVRGDTLLTGGLLFDGPPRVYVRRGQ